MYIFCKHGIWHHSEEQLTDGPITSAPLLSPISTLNPLSNVHSSTSNTMLNQVEFKTQELVRPIYFARCFTGYNLKFKILSRTDQFET